MDFNAIRALAKHHKQSFGRILKCEMYKLENRRLLAITRLHDDFHDMNLAIVLSDTFCIEEIAGEMDRIPQPCCETKPLEMLSSLKGIAVLERGVLRKVKERIPRNMSCTHIYEMIESTFRSVFAATSRIHEKKWDGVLHLEMEEERQLGIQSPILAGTCYTFNLDSANPEVLERARKKIEEARRKIAAIEAVKRGE